MTRSGLSTDMELITKVYEASHGKPPRGLGSWAFCPLERHQDRDYLDHLVWSPVMNWGDAKKWAKTHKTIQKWQTVVVMP